MIDSNKHALNPSYKQIFINYAQDIYDYKESIWEVEFWGNNTGNYTNVAGMVGRNNGILNTADYDFGYSAGMIRSTSVLYDMYAADGIDSRRDWVIAPYYYSGNPAVLVNWTAGGTKFQRYCGKFRREYEKLTPKSTTATPQNFPLLRYSDVLLMYAEAVVQKEAKTTAETDSAYWAVNQVRRRAYGFNLNTAAPTVDVSNLSTSDFLTQIQNERSRELAFECFAQKRSGALGNLLHQNEEYSGQYSGRYFVVHYLCKKHLRKCSSTGCYMARSYLRNRCKPLFKTK